MSLKEKYPNINNLITPIEMDTITKRELEEIKKACKSLSEYMQTFDKPDKKDYESIAQLLEELIEKGIIKYRPNNTAKSLIISRVLLPEDNKIVNTIIDADEPYGSITKKHLEVIIRFNIILKNQVLNPSPNEEFDRQHDIYENFIAILTHLFKQAFDINDPIIILNRITEIMKFNPHYFDKLRNNPTTKK